MPNKFDQIAEKKKRAALAKQDEDVERFAGKVAGEVLGGIGDLSLKDSVAEFATSVAQAVVLSNETLDASLKDNFSQLLAAVKDNKHDDTSQIELSMKIGEQIASLEAAFDKIELSPTINLEGITVEQFRAEVLKIIDRLPKDSQRVVTVAYENATADQYLNVRLTDGLSFYKAGIGAVVAGGSSSGGLTNEELRESPVSVEATIDTTGLATDTGQTAGNASLASIDSKITAVDTGAVTVASSALPTGASTSAKQDTIIGHIDGVETLLGTIDVDTGNIDANAGATGDAASSVGGTGTISAKLRLITSQLNAIDGNTNGIETLLVAIASYVDDLESLVGTSNTKLDTLHADVDGLEGIATAIDGHVDGIETLVAATNTALATIDGRVDGVETLLTAIDSHVDGIEGSVDGIETLIGTTNTTLSTIDGRVDGVETLLTAIDGHVDGIETAIASTNTKLDSEIANSSAIAASASVLDDWDESDRAKVSLIAGQAGVAAAAGTVSAATQRIVRGTGSTSTQTQVADSASSQTILAANTGRIRATIVNDSTVTLYLRESASAATTSVYTYKMYPDETVIIDDYNGALTGIWSSNASGSAVVSEVTA